MFRAIFLDRDGVLIENREDYVREWSHVKVLPKTIDALAGFQALGFKVIVVTNQSAVGRGIITIETAQEINRRLVKSMKESGGEINAVYMCPHKPEDHCNCRKPQPGLLLQAARELSLDLTSSWMVGDAWSDLLAGQSAGVTRVAMVKTGRGASQLLLNQPKEMQSFHIAEDLFKAFHLIAASQRNSS